MARKPRLTAAALAQSRHLLDDHLQQRIGQGFGLGAQERCQRAERIGDIPGQLLCA